jgi:hypothetical protein
VRAFALIALVGVWACEGPPPVRPPCEVAGLPFVAAPGQPGLAHCRCPTGTVRQFRLSAPGLAGTPDSADVDVCLAVDDAERPCFDGRAEIQPNGGDFASGTHGRVEATGTCLLASQCQELLAVIGSEAVCTYADGATVDTATVAPGEMSCAQLQRSSLCDVTCLCILGRCFGLSEASAIGVCTGPIRVCASCDARDACAVPGTSGSTEDGRCASPAACAAAESAGGDWECVQP